MLYNEARKLLIQALEKTHNAKEVAESFSVNRGTVYRLKRQLEETASAAPTAAGTRNSSHLRTFL